MPINKGFTCRFCGEQHQGPPLGYGMEAPAYWSPDLAVDPLNVLEPEICVIKGQGFFVRGLIEIPINGTGDVFSWNVWVSLSKDNFFKAVDVWEQPGRESQPPYFGWLSNELPGYPLSTLNLKTNLHTRPVGERPLIELEPTDHPLAVEQRNGIPHDRLQELATLLLHPPS
ncbi:DUF2199 domain-containing protein [Micromonospora avicenniae]|uniref:DUF2199 domain-containing protein n=1 Tax=Micromonospora avicenniae TaxID=1198245 RepID=UPI003328879E